MVIISYPEQKKDNNANKILAYLIVLPPVKISGGFLVIDTKIGAVALRN